MTNHLHPQATLSFVLDVSQGRAILTASPIAVDVGLRIEGLALAVPAPVAAGDPPARFQRRRLSLDHVTLALDEAALERLVFSRARAGALAAAGLDEPRVRLLDGAVELSGRLRA